MRFPVAAVATLVAITFQCSIDGVRAGAPGGMNLAFIASKKAVQESVGTPLNEFWKDAYGALVREKGSRAARRLRFLLAGVLGHGDELDLTYFLMDKLRRDVFQGRVNKQMWDKLTMELYFALKEWWESTAEHPRDAADLGAWHALVSTYKEVIAPGLRGSNRITALTDILLDPDLKSIRRWIKEWKGVRAASAQGSRSGARGELAKANGPEVAGRARPKDSSVKTDDLEDDESVDRQ